MMVSGVTKRISAIKFAQLSPDEIRKMSATKIITADTYDDEVAVLTDSLMSLMEPLMIIVLGGMVGFIVIALFLPLISLITNLSGGGGK